MKRQEQVLFYQFQDQAKLELAGRTLRQLGIESRILPADAWREKIGYLLGLPGFQAAVAQDDADDFVFPHEVMVLQNIRNKRLDEVLLALKEAGVSHIPFKSVVTPFNTLWTLRRLCLTMQKERVAMRQQAQKKELAYDKSEKR